MLQTANLKPEKSMSFFLRKKTPIVPPAAVAPSPALAASLVPAENADHAKSPPEVEVSAGPVKSDPKKRSCEGIYPDYQKKEFQTQLDAYLLFCTISATSLYHANSVGSTGLTNLYMRTCKEIGQLRKTKLGQIHSCDDCHIDFYVSMVFICSNCILSYDLVKC